MSARVSPTFDVISFRSTFIFSNDVPIGLLTDITGSRKSLLLSPLASSNVGVGKWRSTLTIAEAGWTLRRWSWSATLFWKIAEHWTQARCFARWRMRLTLFLHCFWQTRQVSCSMESAELAVEARLLMRAAMPWAVLMCLLRWPFCTNDLLQVGHEYDLTSCDVLSLFCDAAAADGDDDDGDDDAESSTFVTWSMTWFLRCIFWVKLAEQTLHSNFFLPVCFSMWRAMFLVVMLLPHTEHSELIFDFGTVSSLAFATVASLGGAAGVVAVAGFESCLITSTDCTCCCCWWLWLLPTCCSCWWFCGCWFCPSVDRTDQVALSRMTSLRGDPLPSRSLISDPVSIALYVSISLPRPWPALPAWWHSMLMIVKGWPTDGSWPMDGVVADLSTC